MIRDESLAALFNTAITDLGAALSRCSTCKDVDNERSGQLAAFQGGTRGKGDLTPEQ